MLIEKEIVMLVKLLFVSFAVLCLIVGVSNELKLSRGVNNINMRILNLYYALDYSIQSEEEVSKFSKILNRYLEDNIKRDDMSNLKVRFNQNNQVALSYTVKSVFGILNDVSFKITRNID